jgi:hypothetical protein
MTLRETYEKIQEEVARSPERLRIERCQDEIKKIIREYGIHGQMAACLVGVEIAAVRKGETGRKQRH